MTGIIADPFRLKPRRTHEVCGPGAYLFAVAQCGAAEGHVIWVREGWRTDRMNPTGFAEFFDPANLLVAEAKDHAGVLAVAEEALRSGAVPLVVLEVNKPLDLTAGRRLQLAARDGKALAVSIIPENMGSNACETRWRCTPVFDPEGSTLHQWKLIKNKSGTLGGWTVRWDAKACRFSVVSPARE